MFGKLKLNIRKDMLCQEVTVQDQLVKDQVQAKTKGWGVVRVEAEWVGLLLRGRAEIVYAQAAAQQSLILPDSLAIKEAVRNVVQK